MGSLTFSCLRALLSLAATSLLGACTTNAARPLSFKQDEGVAVVHFGRADADRYQEYESIRTCLVGLRDEVGSTLNISKEFPSSTKLELNPGMYELSVARCAALCSDLEHEKLIVSVESGHAYRVVIGDEINILEAINLQVVVHDETTGRVVASVAGTECEKNSRASPAH